MQVNSVNSTQNFGTNVKSVTKYIRKNSNYRWSNDALNGLAKLANDDKNRKLKIFNIKPSRAYELPTIGVLEIDLPKFNKRLIAERTQVFNDYLNNFLAKGDVVSKLDDITDNLINTPQKKVLDKLKSLGLI